MTITEEMPAKAETVANFLKGLANPHRLLILCALAGGETPAGANGNVIMRMASSVPRGS